MKLFLEKNNNHGARALEKASIILTPSCHMKDFFAGTCKINRDKIYVVYNGFLENFARAQGEGGRRHENLCGRLGARAWACADKIVEAARKLRNYNVHFSIVGNGIDEPRIARLVRHYELENVTLTGRVPIKEAHSYIARSRRRAVRVERSTQQRNMWSVRG